MHLADAQKAIFVQQLTCAEKCMLWAQVYLVTPAIVCFTKHWHADLLFCKAVLQSDRLSVNTEQNVQDRAKYVLLQNMIS